MHGTVQKTPTLSVGRLARVVTVAAIVGGGVAFLTILALVVVLAVVTLRGVR